MLLGCCVHNWCLTETGPLGYHQYIDGLGQDCSISNALAMEIQQSCTKRYAPSWFDCWTFSNHTIIVNVRYCFFILCLTPIASIKVIVPKLHIAQKPIPISPHNAYFHRHVSIISHKSPAHSSHFYASICSCRHLEVTLAFAWTWFPDSLNWTCISQCIPA